MSKTSSLNRINLPVCSMERQKKKRCVKTPWNHLSFLTSRFSKFRGNKAHEILSNHIYAKTWKKEVNMNTLERSERSKRSNFKSWNFSRLIIYRALYVLQVSHENDKLSRCYAFDILLQQFYKKNRKLYNKVSQRGHATRRCCIAFLGDIKNVQQDKQ